MTVGTEKVVLALAAFGAFVLLVATGLGLLRLAQMAIG